ncbi:tol-pal system protein YbgF [Pinisolibacter aquiterrae]|uniref:tol-pal system protein YbgF n=1 Tax=Pinisolibacter aquiterrae TaxID=2815579 RepID=UPI001E4C9788|nr:tol-pal system protein YbgF [Pinisolibacter aquiterrae]MBV5263527.1 tol-pal system protein YbgF [Pinisolibacter aquiterrae]
MAQRTPVSFFSPRRGAARRFVAPLAVLGLAIGLAVFAGRPAAAQGLFGGGGGGDDRQAAEMSVRLNQLEGQMRGLNGQIEQLSFQIRQLQETLARQQKDFEFRLQELENGAGHAAPKPQKKSEAPDDGASTAMAAAPSRGAPPATLGQLPGGADPIGGLIGSSAPMELGAPGVRSRSATPAESAPVPGVDPRYASVAPTASPRDEYDAAYGYILNGEYDLAEQSFKTFLANHPTDKRIGAAQFWLGESYFARQRNKEAADAFLKSYTQFPDGPKAPDSLLKLGMALSGLGEKKAACASWDELLAKYPKASKTVRDRAAAERARGKC